MNYGLKGRVALVNGASSGIGEGVARALAAEGADLVLCARGAQKLEEVAAAISRETGVQALAFSVDVSARGAAKEAVGAAVAAFGGLDILVNNSGGPPGGRFEELSDEQWRGAAELLLMSAVQFSREAIAVMAPRGWGRVINISSISVRQPIDGLMLSNALRSAVIGFAKTLSAEVGAQGITVNNILPGRIHTPRLDYLADRQVEAGRAREEVFAAWTAEIPVGRLGNPGDIGALAAFLASEQASFITGASIPVDGGMIKAL